MRSSVRAIYVSYDGALDPLGVSQVLPYVSGLAARGIAMTLITFEKPSRGHDASARDGVARRLSEAGIRWRPLHYHQRPRVPATAWDVIQGARVIREEVA